MMNCLRAWPEPVVRVQHLSDSGIRVIPDRYVKKPSDRPTIGAASSTLFLDQLTIPVVDMQDLSSDDAAVRQGAMRAIDGACREWGFFQVVNHGVSREVMARTREVWREFFKLPLEDKQAYANSPATYEGYGSRLGVEKGISLDWSDYFFLHYLPAQLRDQAKWPSRPGPCRDLVADYSAQVAELGGKLLKIFSRNLGLEEGYLTEAFGGEDGLGACLRVNYYPKCPQPDLTLGLSPHSDPGGLTLLYADDNVSGLQVRRRCGGEDWVTVSPAADAFIVNLGDQLQVMTNSIYKSVEHRVIVNADRERLSLAMFYNPKGDVVVKPAEQLLGAAPPSYPAMTFDEYRLFIRTRGPRGKAQVESLSESITK